LYMGNIMKEKKELRGIDWSLIVVVVYISKSVFMFLYVLEN